jgi:ADP-heptose:LPS heptosyltransferase
VPWASSFNGSQPQYLVVVRALPGLGDLLCIVPALRALRAALPDARIDLLGLPAAHWFVKRFSHYVNTLIEFPGFPGIPERTPAIHQFPAFLAHMHEESIDLALQMHGNGIVSNPFTLLLGARQSAGFCLPSVFCPDPERFLSYPAHEPEVRRHLRLVEFLGVPLKGEELEFPLDDRDAVSFGQISAARHLVPGAYICIHAGAKQPNRRWSPENFAAVADALAQRGYPIVLTGTKDEKEVAQVVASGIKAPIVDLTGQTDMGALAVLLSRACLLICNDTGVSHLAAALRTPSVVVFVSSDRDRWAPLDKRLHRAVGQPSNQIMCQRCQDAAEHRCLPDACAVLETELQLERQVATPARVLQEAVALLEQVPDVARAEALPTPAGSPAR